MKKLLRPDLYVDSVFDIDLHKLKDSGYDSIIVDIDNTLVAWDEKTAPDSVVEWLENIKKLGFNICLVSNNTEDRVVKFNEDVKVCAIHRASKPRRKPFMKAMDKMNSTPLNTLVIGDQVFTDVLGGNRTGLFTILVVPISGNEFIWTKFVRKIERMVLRNMQKGEKR